MIQFVICDDNKMFVEMVKNVIAKTMMDNKIKYKIATYADYNDEFLEELYRQSVTKIYILDIETPTNNGIDIAIKIRKKDLDSHIIFLTGHEELGQLVLRSDLFFQAFINKYEQAEKRLEKVIRQVTLANFGKNVVRIETRNIMYQFKLTDILYISRENSIRKTVIHTDNGNHEINKPLYEIMELFDERFVQTHRACYVNIERVEFINNKNNMITFDNKEETDLLSLNFKRGFEDKWKQQYY